MKQFRLHVGTSYISYKKDFNSLKSMNQFMKRNFNSDYVYQRLVHVNGNFEPFITFKGMIFTSSTINVLADSLHTAENIFK